MSFDSDRLLDAWLPPPNSGAPVACICSTFTFEPGFFDEDCLSRFLGLDSALVSGGDPGDSRVYVLEREERLTEVSVSVLVDRGHVQGPASFRWDVIPVTAGQGGVQHSKVTLLAWEQVMGLVVTSANLTSGGYRTNIEVFSVFDSNDAPSSLFTDAIDFLERMLSRHTLGSTADKSPRGRARATLAQLRRNVPSPESAGASAPSVRFLHTLDDASLIDQAFSDIWGHPSPPRRLWAVSPYFDRDTPAGLDALSGKLAKRGEIEAELGIVAIEAGDDQVRLLAPEMLRDQAGRGAPELLSWPLDGENEERTLHAKAYLFESDHRTMLVAGSANATVAGLGIGPTRNIEAVVAMGARGESAVGRALDSALPAFAEIPDGIQIFDAQVAEDSEQLPVLPIGFVEALYRPAEDIVDITIRPGSLPAEWTIGSGSDRWFDQSTLRASRSKPATFTLALSRTLVGATAPKTLTVSWKSKSDEWLAAEMVVAVADPAELPEPPEITELTLNELLDLLAVGGRLHDLLRRLVARRAGSGSGVGPTPEIELDPHRKVDTSGFILQRTRRMARAMEGLKSKLGQPVSHPDALDRRLRGRFGPGGLALAADKAVEEGEMAPRERAFMLAELALVISQTRWQPVGRLSIRRCRRAADSTLSEIKPRATGDKAVDRYVAEAFAASAR